MHFSDYRGSISALCATYFPCFAQYSRFGTSADFRYSLTLFLFIVVGITLCVYKWVTYDYTTKRQKYFNKDDNLFAREFFNMWDFRTKRDNDAKHSIEGIQTVIKIMVHEEKIKEEVKNRTASQKCTLYFIRGCLITLSILVLILGWAVIILANLYESNITSYCNSITGLKQISQYIAAISLTVVNYIVPKTLGWITDCEKWDFAHDKLKQEIWRNYLAQMINFLVFLVLQAELVLNKAFFRSSSIISFTNVNKNSTQYDCREDYVALSLFKLFIVELIQRYLYYFGWIIYYRLKASCQRLNNWRKEFEVTDEVVWLIYFQSVIWAGFLYYPFLALLSPIVMYLHFKFIFFRLRRWKIPPNEMNSNLASRGYMMMFLFLTFIMIAFIIILFLLQSIPHYGWVSSSSTLCGPFSSYSSAFSQSSFTSIDPMVILIVIIYAIFFGYYHDRASSLYQQYILDKKKESDQRIDDLKIERSGLNKKILYMRKQNNFE